MSTLLRRSVITLFLIFFVIPAFSQYFGQNKVNYEQFDFTIHNTPHFQIYNYLDNNEAVQGLGKQAEYWYDRHFAIFRDTVLKNPLILYNDHPDFMQTTVISGLIGVGTGGVTEGLRKRVVMPFTVSNKATDHVLGHEMIHVFQYNVIHQDDSLGFESLNNLPLWMIEGLAEYMSIGPSDNQTAMWMRDALLHDNVPSIDDMTKYPNKYFPYRYGHAYWSFITGIWGDAMIKPIFKSTAQRGMKNAINELFGLESDSLSTLWEKSFKKTFEPYVFDTLRPVGKELFSKKNSGNMNLSPVLNPSGEQVTFLTNKNVISIDLMVANTETKEIVNKLTSTIRKTHIDEFNYIESAGSWSPDGKKYALTTFSKGRNRLVISSVSKNRAKLEREIKLPGIQAFNNPEWSPDGETILLTGLVDGKSDLYLYHLKSGEIEQLTDDRYSDLQPSWSSDGEKIVFISERGEDTKLDKHVYGNYRVCILDRETKEVEVLDIFPDKDNFSPTFSPNDSSIYFLSHADGYRNLYEYEIHEDKVYRLTKFVTGNAGITDLSPAYSVAEETGEIAYTLYGDDSYQIYLASPDEFDKEEVDKHMANSEPEKLPPGKNRSLNLVENNLENYPEKSDTVFSNESYKPKFELEYLGSSGMGVGTGQFGTYASGGVSALFSDVLKQHQLFVNLQVQGEIYDFGGYGAYYNREKRLNWGGSFSHIPYRFFRYGIDTVHTDITGDGEKEVLTNVIEMRQRFFQDQISVFGQYPLSQQLRFEGSASISRYSFRIDSINNYYYGSFLGQEREKVDGPDPYYVGRGQLAFVGDDSNFGITGPLSGYRYRFQVEKMFAEYDVFSTLADYRKYFYFKPIGLGFRGMHFARYGSDANRLYPQYVGDNYFIRGYAYNTLSENPSNQDYITINNLLGSKIGVFNAEVRMPISGPKQLTPIKSRYFYSTLVGFFDAGFAVESWDDFKLSWEPSDEYRSPVFSTGISLRINLFGYAILEPYVAIPFQLERKGVNFGLFITGSGW
ncbi:MAG: hypothetical protein ACLFT4_06585 [Bacteroidales bacterium]